MSTMQNNLRLLSLVAALMCSACGGSAETEVGVDGSRADASVPADDAAPVDDAAPPPGCAGRFGLARFGEGCFGGD